MSIYKDLSHEMLEEHFSQFLINSWSYSKVSTFARNEKAFEMTNIFGCGWKSSPSSVAGTAYHEAVESYFKALKEGEKLDIVTLEEVAFDKIDMLPARDWKLGKTTPTVEECKKVTFQTVSVLLRNFLSEIETYLEEIKEILDVEVYCNEFLTINGVDIPLPCHALIDLVVLTNKDKIAVVDHKSKKTFTSEEEMVMAIGRQAITYSKSYESKTGKKVDSVWFVENKYSINKDKSPQVQNFKIDLDIDTERLYEALLYEPLKRMVQAVNDPDYVYLINDSDNLVDKAEMYDFWARTMISEVEDFNVEETKKELVSKRLKKIRDSNVVVVNPNLIKKFRSNASQFIQYDMSGKDMTQEEKIEHILRSFGVIVKVAHKFEGYSSNTYLLEVSAGVKISSIHSHKLDIANALDVSNVRISTELKMHENKSYLSIEFAKKRDKTLIFDGKTAINGIIPLGRDNFNREVVWDTENSSTAHILICGSTGSGKSVEIRVIIESAKLLGFENIVILDPKNEFKKLASTRISVYNKIDEIEAIMELMVDEMNNMVENGSVRKTLIIFDEYADAISNSRKGVELKKYEMQTTSFSVKGIPKMERVCIGESKSLEQNLQLILQLGRTSGFRVAAATQRASVKVINGDAKVNFPVLVCFRVPRAIDSKVVLDEEGAEGLSGKGDGLIKSPEYMDTVRFQSYYCE